MKFVESPLQKAIGLVEMQKASAKFQEITQSIRADPRLLSLMEKRRGQKGFREMQGEALRQTCKTILAILVSWPSKAYSGVVCVWGGGNMIDAHGLIFFQNAIMLKVKKILNKTVEEFPRLCYVTERDLLTVACNRGNPVPIIPIITRVFPAIHSIRFNELIPSKNTLALSGTEEEGKLKKLKL